MATWIGAVGAAAAAAFTLAAGAQTPPTTTQPTPTPPPVASPTPSTQPSGSQSGQMGSSQSGQMGSSQSGQMGSSQSGQMSNGQSGQTSNGQSGQSGSGQSQQGTQKTSGTERISVPLKAMPAGNVTLNVDPRTHHVNARLNLIGLAPGTQHQIALYAGRDRGQPEFTFNDVTVDASGRIQQIVTSNQTARHGLPRDLYFRVDLLPSQSGGDQQQIAVAHRVVSGSRNAFLTLAFESTIADSGHAELTYDPATQKLTVSLQVNDLAPGSAHAAHIHAGSCSTQGAVLYPLPDLVANANGTASETTTISVTSPPPASGWYVNVHDGTMNNILQADGQPGPLFQPLVCGNVHAPHTTRMTTRTRH